MCLTVILRERKYCDSASRSAAQALSQDPTHLV